MAYVSHAFQGPLSGLLAALERLIYLKRLCDPYRIHFSSCHRHSMIAFASFPTRAKSLKSLLSLISMHCTASLYERNHMAWL